MAKQSITFAATFVGFFLIAYVFLAALDILPEPINTQSGDAASAEARNAGAVGPGVTGADTASQQPGELPVRVVAKKIGLDVSVSNTDSTDVETLDNLLVKGAVRYPSSATLGQEGTVLLFGHSSYLPVVRNQNFKAFNGLQNLKEGDTVSVYSSGTEYRYSVVGVRLANALEDVVELPATGKHLALVTCDSFGKKTSRYVLTADLVGTYPM